MAVPARTVATYARIFLDTKHNRKRLLMDDCLRCHGMHFEGGIRDLVTPVEYHGPWSLRRTRPRNRPAIPCLACHRCIGEGEPPQACRMRAVPGPRQEIKRPSLALFDRRTQAHVSVAVLSLPAMTEGERPVKMSPDQRQALCYQCHAASPARRWGRATTAPAWACTKASVAWPAIRSTASRRGHRAPTAIRGCRTAGWMWRRWIRRFSPPQAAQHPLREVRGLPSEGNSSQARLIAFDTHFEGEVEYHAIHELFQKGVRASCARRSTRRGRICRAENQLQICGRSGRCDHVQLRRNESRWKKGKLACLKSDLSASALWAGPCRGTS